MSIFKNILNHLKPPVSVWSQNGAVFELLPDGNTQKYTPKEPGQLSEVEFLVMARHKAKAGKSELPEHDQEVAEEALLPLIKPPEILPSYVGPPFTVTDLKYYELHPGRVYDFLDNDEKTDEGELQSSNDSFGDFDFTGKK